MIQHPNFPIEPWQVRETHLDLDILAQTESIFALANGHIGWRANLDEGEPHGIPGSYLNGVFELHPMPYAEAGFGYPESGQSLINVTNGKLIRLLVDDEPLDIRYGQLRHHERCLDLRAGLLTRDTEWTSPADCTVRVRSTRLVSFTQRAVAAIRYEVEPVDTQARVVLQSELVANEELPRASGDPREALGATPALISEHHAARDGLAQLIHSTQLSTIRVSAAMDHVITGPEGLKVMGDSTRDWARVTVAVTLEPGEKLCLVKFVAYGWSATRSLPALRDQAMAALTAARITGWEGLVSEQRDYLDDFWAHADVELDGDPEIQQAVRFSLFHVLQAGARGERRAIPAKGLTGPGYEGHTFWDTETFVLPVLMHTAHRAAADELRWRHSTLPAAREQAQRLGLAGAAFPWRTIRGEECSGYWPAGTAAFHVSADVADAARRYVEASEDMEFEREVGLELLAETARLWKALGHNGDNGEFRIDGVTGPDEYSAIADNNVYTNLMARHNLLAAAEAAGRHPDRAGELGIGEEEVAGWVAAAKTMVVPYDEVRGVHPQSEGFTHHQVWDFASTPPETYPLLLHYPYFDIYRKQVVKQADLVLAMQLCPDQFSDEEKARNFAYYERITVRDSSLSACSQAVMAAEVGHLDLAYDYLGETALIDLDDLQHNTRDGVHLASLAGSWLALVAGFGGMRAREGVLCFAPRLPRQLRGLCFTVWWRGRRLRVEIKAASAGETATYRLAAGPALEIRHHGESVLVEEAQPVTCPIPAPPAGLVRPTQPAGREPAHREIGGRPADSGTPASPGP